MIVDAAFWPTRAHRRGPARWEVAAFAAAFVIAGLVALTLAFAGEAAYADIALPPNGNPATFRIVDTPPGVMTGGRMTMSRDELLELHRRWVAYVSGRSDRQPPNLGAADYFTVSERAHMVDVRTVFTAAQIAAALAALLLVWLMVRSRRRGALARLLRDGAVTALVAVTAIGLFAAASFDAAFLLFHRIFFPQGNFLFEPGSNLLALYPESYFYGVTLRIGLAFVALAAVIAAVSHAALRRGPRSA